jgi:hypothetical protein
LLDQISFARKKLTPTSHFRNQQSCVPSSQSVTISTPPSGNSLLRFAPDIDLRQYPIDATLASTMFPKSLRHEPEAHSQKVSKQAETHFKTSFPSRPGRTGSSSVKPPPSPVNDPSLAFSIDF